MSEEQVRKVTSARVTAAGNGFIVEAIGDQGQAYVARDYLDLFDVLKALLVEPKGMGPKPDYGEAPVENVDVHAKVCTVRLFPELRDSLRKAALDKNLAVADLLQMMLCDGLREQGYYGDGPATMKVNTHAAAGVIELPVGMGNRIGMCAADAERKCEGLIVDMLDDALHQRGY